MQILISINQKRLFQFFFFCRNRRVFLFFMLILWTFSNVYSQNQQSNGKIFLKIFLPKEVRNNHNLIASIVLINKSDTALNFYEKLVEGFYMSKSFNEIPRELTNFQLKVEKKNRAKYVEYSNRVLIDPGPDSSFAPILTRKRVGPNDSLTIYFHVDSRFQFEVGTYRMKCFFWNDLNNDSSIESNWINFRVLKKLNVVNYDAESFVNP